MAHLQSVPQSNQRGIETALVDTDPPRYHPGLNRTSVGLKQRPTVGCRFRQ